MLMSKWRDLRQNFRKFNGIYKKRLNARKSDQSKQNIQEEALDEYRQTGNGTLCHIKA
jgi:hypothetical protein